MSRPGASRRTFLQAGAVGAAGAGLAAVSGGAPAIAASGSGCPMGGTATGTPSAMFGRMFADLPPFADNTASLRTALLDLAAPGGMLDAQDDLFGPDGGPVLLITDPNLSLVNQNNPHDTAGMTFVGQFIDHDLTFDATSRLGVPTDPTRSPNGRTARFDLDSVYGGGPIAQSELYDPAHPIKLLLESGGQFEDVPRRGDHSAVIGDPRNDSNLIVNGLHAAFLRFHNQAVDDVTTSGAEPIETFTEARRLTTWHYQWLVVNQVLPNFVGQPMVDDVLQHGPTLLPRPRRAVHPGRVLRGGLPVRSQHGAAVVPREPRRRRRQPVLRPDLRLAGRRTGRTEPDQRPRRPPRRLPLVPTVRRLADLLRLRWGLHGRGPTQQADRHRAVDAAVRPAHQRDRAHSWRPRTGRPAAAHPAPAPDLVAAVRAGHRPARPRARAVVRRPVRSRCLRPPVWTARPRSGSTSCARRSWSTAGSTSARSAAGSWPR